MALGINNPVHRWLCFDRNSMSEMTAARISSFYGFESIGLRPEDSRRLTNAPDAGGRLPIGRHMTTANVADAGAATEGPPAALGA
jgi:hypothetical protein